MEKKINITSTAIEKGIDIAKEFLEKLIMPTVEETGLLVRDKVTMWRFSNQIKMLNKAKLKCEKNGISLKTISLKILCPLLEYAGLEEDEILQDKWANLLTNMVDSSQNLENHVFPYLLSQVSVDEFLMVEAVYKKRVEWIIKRESELQDFLNFKMTTEKELKEQIKKLENEMNCENKERFSRFETQKTKRDREMELRKLETKEHAIRQSINQPEIVPTGELKKYEISNLIRLGIIKSIPRPYAYVEKHGIQNNPDSEYLYLEGLEIMMDADEDDLVLTELGELFIAACNEKEHTIQKSA